MKDLIKKHFLKDSPDSYYLTEIISKNIAKDNRNFLVCTNVIAARTGIQLYSGREIGVVDSKLQDERFYLERPSSEVFSEDTIKSFDNAPFTDGHIASVNSKNSNKLLKGFVRDARKADFKDKDGNELLVVDVIVTDQKLIEAIENGKREVSAGYSWDYEIIDFEARKIKVTNIRANHLALVNKGRAGSAMILDEKLDKLSIIEKLDMLDNLKGGKDMSEIVHKFSYKDKNNKEKELHVRGFENKDEAKTAALDFLEDQNKNKEEK